MKTYVTVEVKLEIFLNSDRSTARSGRFILSPYKFNMLNHND
jgi:hypothetical protein